MSTQNTSFAGKTVLITGATSGIGRTTALELARRGANIVLTGRRGPEGEQAARDVQALGVKAAFVRGDVTDESHVRLAVDTALNLTGTLDAAFNNAGLELGNVPTVEASSDLYRKIFDVNVLGVLLSMKHQLRVMKAGAAIVNNASVAGSIGMPGVGIYIASKHAVLGLTKTAALEVAKAGIRVNAVSPAAIETPMLDRFTGGGQEALQWMQSMHPVGRIGKPEEIAKTVVFLLSEDAGFITGQDIKVDGGFTVP